MFRSLLLSSLLVSPAFAADLVLRPDGVEAGDQYRLLIVTSQTRDAFSSDIHDYNEFVQSVADASPVVGSWNLTWSAVVSTADTHAFENTGADPTAQDPIPNTDKVPVHRVDGELIYSDYQHMWNYLNDIALVLPNLNELGDQMDVEVWAGHGDAGEVFDNFTLGAQFPYVGFSGIGNTPLSISISREGQELRSLFAISEVITVVPEPRTISLLLLSFFWALVLRGRSRR